MRRLKAAESPYVSCMVGFSLYNAGLLVGKRIFNVSVLQSIEFGRKWSSFCLHDAHCAFVVLKALLIFPSCDSSESFFCTRKVAAIAMTMLGGETICLHRYHGIDIREREICNKEIHPHKSVADCLSMHNVHHGYRAALHSDCFLYWCTSGRYRLHSQVSLSNTFGSFCLLRIPHSVP